MFASVVKLACRNAVCASVDRPIRTNTGRKTHFPCSTSSFGSLDSIGFRSIDSKSRPGLPFALSPAYTATCLQGKTSIPDTKCYYFLPLYLSDLKRSEILVILSPCNVDIVPHGTKHGTLHSSSTQKRVHGVNKL